MFRVVVAASGVFALGFDFDDGQASDAVYLLQKNAKKSSGGWARGMNLCREMPPKSRSGCEVLSEDASQKTPRDCARWARSQKANGINFGPNECEAIKCSSTNLLVESSQTDVGVYSDYCGLDTVRKNITGECTSDDAPESSKYYEYPLPSRERLCRYRPSFKKLVYNNIMNGGMRFQDVLQKTGGTDLLVTAETGYSPANPSATGHNKYGNMGVINVKSNTSVELTFSLVKRGTNDPKTEKSFTFSVFDIDQGPKCRSRAMVTATNFHSYKLDSATELVVKNGPMENPWTSFKSSQRGVRGDDPSGPQQLKSKKGHSRRAVTLFYTDVSSFKVTFSLEGEGSARNFMFGGLSSLLKKHCKDVTSLKEVLAKKKARRQAKIEKKAAAAQEKRARKQRRAARMRARKAEKLKRNGKQ